MNEQDFTDEIHELARQVAGMLAGKTPYERALILHQAQSIWDDLQEQKLGRADARQAEDEGTFMDMTAAWVGAVLHELPPSSRAEVMQVLSELRQNAHFDKLTRGVDISPKPDTPGEEESAS